MISQRTAIVEPARPAAANESRIAYPCKFCHKVFKRSDVRRVHYTRCWARISSGAAVPLTARKGRKTRACDDCAQRKRACDGTIPCSQCASRQAVCTRSRMISNAIGNGVALKTIDAGVGRRDSTDIVYVGVVGEVAPKESEPVGPYEDLQPESTSMAPFFTETPLEWMPRPEDTFPPIPGSLRPTIYRPENGTLPFLLNFTTRKGISSLFNFTYFNSRHKSRTDVAALTHPMSSFWDLNFDTPLLTRNPPFVDFLGTGVFEATSNTEVIPQLSTVQSATESLSSKTLANPPIRFLASVADQLFLRTRELWLKLEEMDSVTGMQESSRSLRCLQFFCPSNIRRFVDTFWDDWYPHGPIIHRPSFDMHTAPPGLLLSMVLMGAIMSPNPGDKEMAKEWLDATEEICFADLHASQQSEQGGISSQILGTEKPCWLQAAYIICCVQNWEGNLDAKTRIRRKRFNSLVEASRLIGFHKATHHAGEGWSGGLENFDWPQYISREELIRTMQFIYLVDTSFVVFHNAPCKLLLQDMKLDLVSPAVCFESESRRKCFFELQRLCPAGSLRTKLSFEETVQILQYNSFDEATSSVLLHLDSLNLFGLLAALYTPFFQQQSTWLSTSELQTYFERSLNTWQLLWNVRSDIPSIQSMESQDTIEPWKRVGFYRHADEWRQFSAGVMRFLQARNQTADATELDSSDFSIYHEYDESSTEQVARVLSALQF